MQFYGNVNEICGFVKPYLKMTKVAQIPNIKYLLILNFTHLQLNLQILPSTFLSSLFLIHTKSSLNAHTHYQVTYPTTG